MVALWPLLVGLEGSYPFFATHGAIARALQAHRVDLVDTLPAFEGQDPETLWVHPSDRHPNARAHRVFAAALLEPVSARLTSGGDE